jgi:hypothetical protein
VKEILSTDLAVELGFDLDDLDPLLLPFALPLLEEGIQIIQIKAKLDRQVCR